MKCFSKMRNNLLPAKADLLLQSLELHNKSRSPAKAHNPSSMLLNQLSKAWVHWA